MTTGNTFQSHPARKIGPFFFFFLRPK